MSDPKSILKSVYGYDEFRPLQEEIIEHCLSGQDSIVIMPTGGGKSVCFQIPAIIKDKLTLVISPLISLMKDQVETLRANGINAAYFNSTLSDQEKHQLIKSCSENKVKLLYLSPETFITGFHQWIKHLSISLIAIDEAHCVSMWGHDFRPEYGEIGKLRSYYEGIPFMALTATADKPTRSDIAENLGLNNPQLFLSSFNRQNLSLTVRSQVPKKNKQKEILNFLNSRKEESGIVYCLSRKETEEWSAFLNEHGFNSRHYHAGLSNAERDLVQEGFINDQFDIICATIAFGMGIDKPDVRWIIHNNLPKNIEGYYQEIGRAGRDGLPSDTILYYNYRDVVLLNDFASNSSQENILREKIKRILQYAEATSCRRNILLSYFGEFSDQPCKNCDVCENPPEFNDGTIEAQKALSAIYRLKEDVGMNVLINVLRGAKTANIFSKNYHKIKTYGAGSEHSFKSWQHYINQLINLGFIEIDYTDHLKLKITSPGNNVLKGTTKVNLAEFSENEIKRSKKTSKDTSKNPVNEDVLSKLKALRIELAKVNRVPAYVIFNDKTLQDLLEKLPSTNEELLNIHGMGEKKVERFGNELLEIIAQNKDSDHKKSTYDKTFELYESGKTIQEISEIRSLHVTTVYSHMVKLFEQGKKVDLFKFISEYEFQRIKSTRKELNNPSQLKPIYEALNGEVEYSKINIAMIIMERQN